MKVVEAMNLMVPEALLLQVTKPARYIGQEINMVEKNPREVDIRFAFCFPDVYEVGMSHLGMQILYYFLNRRTDTYCERVYAPWHDMEEVMRSRQIPLFALESQEAIKDFDFVAFTLQYEMSYTNILNMLDLAGIPLYRTDRTEKDPLVIFGGPGAYNPEPLADFADFFYLGEGEVLYDDILALYKEGKRQGETKQQFLEKLLAFDGIYIPQFYDVTYKDTGEIALFQPNHLQAKAIIKKVVVSDMDQVFYPEKQLVPLIEIVHDRVTLELFRGCIRGCRFCQAGYVYRPVRGKRKDTLLQQAQSLVDNSGHEEISLISLSTSDYQEFDQLVPELLECFSHKKVNISLPSLRIDAFALDIMKKVQSVRKSSLTFAPEAGTQRMRDVINKNLTEEEILNGCAMAFESGWERVKLYFMTGLPGETMDDVAGIAKLSEKIVETYYAEKRKRPVKVVVSNSFFVPKPFTPFQWDAQNTEEEFIQKAHMIKNKIHNRHIQYNYHDVHLSVLEGVLARGDRRVSKAIYNAFKLGCKFDSWSEHFSYERWQEAFETAGIDPRFYASRKREIDEVLPWDHIDIGVSKSFMVQERLKAEQERTSPNCRDSCLGCGANCFEGGICP